MYRAIYPFDGTIDGTLSFKQNDILIVIQPIDQNWYFGCIGNKWGFIPIKYIQEIRDKDYNYIIKSVSSCIEKLQAIPEKQTTKDQRSALRKLLKFRESILEEQKQSTFPNGNCGDIADSTDHSEEVTAASCQPSFEVASHLSRLLVEQIRITTQGSHTSCSDAVRRVLSVLSEHVGSQSPDISYLVDQLSTQLNSSDLTDDVTMLDSHDWQAFDRLLQKAEKRRDDWQERGGWSLHESEGEIKDEMTQLAEIIAKADLSLTRRRLAQDNYSSVLCLADLHSVEVRPSVRHIHLQVLAGMCQLDKEIVHTLLNSCTFPTDLIRDVKQASPDESLITYSLLLLAMLFSSQIEFPNSVQDSLNQDFYTNLFEKFVEADEESLTDATMTFLLAISLHFEVSPTCGDNPLFLSLLSNPDAVQKFTEHLLLIFNRAEDPTQLLDHSPPSCNSVLHMLTIIFSSPSTADIFYTNDIHVLVDVVCRDLSDLSHESMRLPPIMFLLTACVRSASYQTSMYKSAELRKALRRFVDCEEASESIRRDSRVLSQLLFQGVMI